MILDSKICEGEKVKVYTNLLAQDIKHANFEINSYLESKSVSSISDYLKFSHMALKSNDPAMIVELSSELKRHHIDIFSATRGRLQSICDRVIAFSNYIKNRNINFDKAFNREQGRVVTSKYDIKNILNTTEYPDANIFVQDIEENISGCYTAILNDEIFHRSNADAGSSLRYDLDKVFKSKDLTFTRSDIIEFKDIHSNLIHITAELIKIIGVYDEIISNLSTRFITFQLDEKDNLCYETIDQSRLVTIASDPNFSNIGENLFTMIHENKKLNYILYSIILAKFLAFQRYCAETCEMIIEDIEE